jgi:hypothetical protein
VPLRITGNPTFDALIVVAVVVISAKVLLATREGIRWKLRLVLVTALGVVLGVLIASAANLRTDQVPLVGAIMGLAAGFAVPKRSRHIPARVRREVIARDLRGKKFDPHKHHIDHTWPFSRGGSHTTDNLRVTAKRENLRKGAKLPRLWDIFR